MDRSSALLAVIETFLLVPIFVEIDRGVHIVRIEEHQSIRVIVLFVSLSIRRGLEMPDKVVGEAGLPTYEAHERWKLHVLGDHFEILLPDILQSKAIAHDD